MWDESRGSGLIVIKRFASAAKIGILGKFHLDGVNALMRTAIVTGGPATLEAAIGHPCETIGTGTYLTYGLFDFDRTSHAFIRPYIEVRELAIKQIRDVRSD